MSAKRSPLERDDAAKYEVDGNELSCPVCGHQKFWLRTTLLNTGGMTFFGIEWANRRAKNYVCNRCGYMMWFIR